MSAYRNTVYDDRFARIVSRSGEMPCSALERTLLGYLVDDLRTMLLLLRRAAGRLEYTRGLLRTIERRVVARVCFMTLFLANRIGVNPALSDRYLAEQDYLREIERLALDVSAAAEEPSA